MLSHHPGSESNMIQRETSYALDATPNGLAPMDCIQPNYMTPSKQMSLPNENTRSGILGGSGNDATHFLLEYETLAVIGSGSFGRIVKVLRKSDGKVRKMCSSFVPQHVAKWIVHFSCQFDLTNSSEFK
jgi:hypothetical protein